MEFSVLRSATHMHATEKDTHTHAHTSDLATADIYSSNMYVWLVFALGNTMLIVTDILMNDRKWSTHSHTNIHAHTHFIHSIHISMNYMQCTNKCISICTPVIGRLSYKLAQFSSFFSSFASLLGSPQHFIIIIITHRSKRRRNYDAKILVV